MKKNKMISCPTCGREVSSNAAACPGCAEPIAPSKTNTAGINLRDPVHVIGLVVCLLVIVGIVVFVHDALI